MFTTNPQTIAAGKTALRIICAGFLISSVSVTACGALEGLGRGTASLIVSLCRYLVIILPAAFVLSHFFGAVGVWNAFWIAEALTAGVSLLISKRVIRGYNSLISLIFLYFPLTHTLMGYILQV